MRAAPRPWFQALAPVPLTGREPVLGHLRTRLAGRGPGWGRTLILAPRGGGVSRLLTEVAGALDGEGEAGAPLLRVGTALPGAPPFEPVRRALDRLLGSGPREWLARRVEATVGATDVARTLLAWVLDGPEAGAAPLTDEDLRQALGLLAAPGPLLVDDLDRLDPRSRHVLLAAGGIDGPGLLAGASLSPHAEGWRLAPLGGAQVELLLRRWLRHPVTVRRLAPVAIAHTDGWPGLLVRALRRLGASGALVAERRGVALRTWPLAWPTLEEAPAAFPAWWSGLPACDRVVFEAAALQQDDLGDALLAAAADVKPAVVEHLRAEVGLRWPSADGDLFPSPAARTALAADLDAARRRVVGERLWRAWVRRAPQQDRGARDAIARLRAAVLGGDQAAIDAARDALLRQVPDREALAPPVRALLAGGLAALPAAVADEEDLRKARRMLLRGERETGLAALERIARDAARSTPVRVEALARLAHACLRAGDEHEARRFARRASNLLDAERRARQGEGRLHRILAVAWGALGESGVAARHRHAARRAHRLPAAGVST